MGGAAPHPPAFLARLGDRRRTPLDQREPRPERQRPGSIEGCTEKILTEMAAHRIHTEPLVTDMVRPEEVEAAYRVLDEDTEHHLGVLVDWR